MFRSAAVLVRDDGAHVFQRSDSDCEPSAIELDVEPFSHKHFHCLGALKRRVPIERLQGGLQSPHHNGARLVTSAW